MSLHAQLSPETVERLRIQQRNNTVTSILISVLVIVLLGVVMFWFLLPSAEKYTDDLVAYPSSASEEQSVNKPKVQRTVETKPSTPSASASVAKVLSSNSQTNVVIPVTQEVTLVESQDLGAEIDFGDWGAAAGATGSGDTSFFGTNISGEKFLYIIDYSLSMKGIKDKLMREELVSSVKRLPEGAKFQLLFFAGPAWLASDEIGDVQGAGVNTITTAEGKTLKWEQRKTDGKVRKIDWMTVTKSTVDASIDRIEESPLVLGTAWAPPFEMAFEMRPKPDAIIFMTDGLSGDGDKVAAKYGDLARKHDISISAIALVLPAARESMETLAKKSNGSFAIIDRKGRKTESEDYSKQ